MTALRTVFSVIPEAQAVECALRVFKALPLADSDRLVGLFVPSQGIFYGVGFDGGGAELVAAQIEAAEEEQKAIENVFKPACEQAGIAYEWRDGKISGELISPQAGAMARAADLIIYPKLSEEGSFGRHQIEEIVFTSGRPVFAVPTGGQETLLAGMSSLRGTAAGKPRERSSTRCRFS